jgi:hypothetical protein
MMKRLTSLALILIIALTGCSFSPVDRSAGAQSADSDVPSQDLQHRVGFGYITNRMELAEDNRANSVVDALAAVLAD